MRMQLRFIPSFMVLMLVASLSGCGQSTQAGAPPQAPAPEVNVVTIAPQQVTLSTVLAGRTSAFLVADVRPQVSGIVQKRLFREGALVKAGELLYQIDPATYQAAYNSARAALAKAEANALPAKLKAERFAGLSKVRAVSQQDNDDAQAAHHQAEAEVGAAKAALDAARINLSYTRVSAPIAGRIGKSTVTPGALVTASQSAALATIQQTDQIYVDVTQSSGELLRLRRELASGKLKKAGNGGAKVKLLFEDGSAYARDGLLQFSDITVDQGTGAITMRAVFPNPNGELLPGLYVRAVLEEGVEDQGILVPQQAVTRDSKGDPLVMLVKADGTVEPRPIAVNRVVDDKWLVESGLAAGDRVIVEGLQKARPGAKVKALEMGAAAAPAAQQNASSAEVSAAPKAEAAQEAPRTAAAVTAEPAPAVAKAEPATAVMKADAAAAKPARQVSAKLAAKPGVKPKDALVYSPPKDEPWPGSAGSAAPEHAPEHASAHATDQQ
ncbi:MAG: efflux RND transporter periplasmic adaptor subunit [Humidesulfovibrio sp.]|nr:efflux RND transporter periplasmic adaptor subunit [Humidesulfovibrio sp.]